MTAASPEAIWQDIGILAAEFHWSLEDIVSMPHVVRLQAVTLAQRAQERREGVTRGMA
jgi:hypothetical protein